jgi:hypothetical protein
MSTRLTAGGVWQIYKFMSRIDTMHSVQVMCRVLGVARTNGSQLSQEGSRCQPVSASTSARERAPRADFLVGTQGIAAARMVSQHDTRRSSSSTLSHAVLSGSIKAKCPIPGSGTNRVRGCTAT